MENKIEKLKTEGYELVYVWDAEPNEEDPDHEHPFDTHLIVLNGEIEIRMDGNTKILKTDDELDIPRQRIHYGKAGQNGCKYIVAEKHYPDGSGNK